MEPSFALLYHFGRLFQRARDLCNRKCNPGYGGTKLNGIAFGIG